MKNNNELYLGKIFELSFIYRKKKRKVRYVVTKHKELLGCEIELRAERHPCEIPNMEYIKLKLHSDFTN